VNFLRSRWSVSVSVERGGRGRLGQEQKPSLTKKKELCQAIPFRQLESRKGETVCKKNKNNRKKRHREKRDQVNGEEKIENGL